MKMLSVDLKVRLKRQRYVNIVSTPKSLSNFLTITSEKQYFKISAPLEVLQNKKSP